MNSINILHVIASMDPEKGGVCKAVRIIISGLKKFNILSEVVSTDSPHASYIKEDPFPTHAIGIGRTPWGYNKDLVSWLVYNLDRFELVIVHGLWLYPSYAAKKAIDTLRRNGRNKPKLFLMPHGMLDPYFQVASGRKLKAIRNWLFWKLVEGRLIEEADGVLYTCEMEMILAKQPFKPFKPKKEVVVGLGVEASPTYSKKMNEAFKSKSGLQNEKPFLLYLSRIHEKKGIDLLINAYINLSGRVKNMPSLVIAGPGLQSEYGVQMMQLAAESSNIYFTGMLTGDEKWGAFYGCEAFVLPSHQENFGIAVVEALACGKPVLISDQVNIWKEIEKMSAGFIAPDTFTGTVQLLERWVTLSDIEKARVGKLAKECYERNFSIDPVAKMILKIIEN